MSRWSWTWLGLSPQGVLYRIVFYFIVSTLYLTVHCACIIASGIRNSVGFDWHPQTAVLYFTDNGRDKIGDDSPDCELNRLPSKNYNTRTPPNFGFPYCQTQVIGAGLRSIH